VETSLTAEAGPHEEDAFPARPAYASILEKRLDALSDFERDIIERRFLVEDSETLDAIGASWGYTRERVRQVEVRALGRLVGGPERKTGRCPADGDDAGTETIKCDVVREAVAQLQELPLPVTDGGLVEAGFEPLDSMGSRLLFVIAKKAGTSGGGKLAVTRYAGQRWLALGNQTPQRLVRDLTESARCTGVVTDLVEFWSGIEEELRPHVGSDQEAADLAADIVQSLGLEEIGGQHAVLGGGIGIVDRLVHILRANGAPMDRNILLGYFPDRSARSMSNVLLQLPFVRVGRDEFALEEWGATPRPQLRDLLYDELDRYGQVGVSYLADLAVEYGFSRASITFYSSLPDVIEEAGVLRRRRPGDPPAVPDPGLDDKCFRVVAGAYRGCWSSMVIVSHRRLYLGPQPIPTPLAELLEIEPGARRVPVTLNGAGVHVTWLQSPYLFGGELRPVLDALGFADGELIRLVVTGPGALLAERVPAVTGPDTPFRTLVTGACLYDETGAPVPDSEIAAALAYSIGLDSDTPLPIVGRRLASRHDPALHEALNLIFPEVCLK
jgi:hypothetical protein